MAYMGTRLCVPLSMRQKVMYHTHDLKSIHSGTQKTIDLLQRTYWWPGMGKDVKNWIGTCDDCQHKSRNRKNGYLHSLEIHQHRFTDFAMDWCNAPFSENGFDQILIGIDRLRKHLTLMAAKATHTAEETGCLVTT